MDFGFSDQAEEFRAEFRLWLQESLPAEWRDLARGTDEEHLISIRRAWGIRLLEGGWAGPSWPKEYGGLGLLIEQQAILLEELTRAGAPEALNSNGISIFAPTLIHYGTEEQKKRYLPKMLSHEEIWCQGFSEPEAGSDLAGLQTRAEATDGGFTLKGQKVWTTNGHLADMCYILVRTDPAGSRHAGISMMMMKMRQPGVTVRPLRTIAGTEEFSEVFLDDAFVPDEDLVGEPGNGWDMATYALSLERSLNFAERSLRMRRELGKLMTLVEEQKAARNPRASDPVFEDRLVDSFIASTLLGSLVLRTLAMTASGEPLGTLPSTAKLYWSEAHQDLLGLSLDLLGEHANDSEYEEWVRGVLLTRGETIYAGTSEIQRNLIAKGLGLPSSRGGG